MPRRAERFPDKKRAILDYDRTTDYIREAKSRMHSAEVAQDHATWNMYGEYPTTPHAFVYITDVHYGSVGVDYDLLDQTIDTVLQTPNLFAVFGGDLIDAFSPIRHATGMRGNPVGPDEQIDAMMDLLSTFDRAGKLGAVQLGNHDSWSELAGYNFQMFLKELQAPVFSGDGVIDVNVGEFGMPYKVYWSHTHWGNSKLNITNAAKRALQFTAPKADIALLGHTHQAAFEIFDIGGETRGAVVGGTFKRKDSWASKWGLSKPGLPAPVILFWPDKKHFEIVKDVEQAANIIRGLISKGENGVTSYEEMINR